MKNNERNLPGRTFSTTRKKGENAQSGNGIARVDVSKSYEEMAAELDELAAVPTDVLASWVTDRGRCLWESTFGEPPAWSGAEEPDRELAARLCAGCPVRVECLEFELRLAGDQTVGVWGALNEDDRRALHTVWSCRRRVDLEALPEGDGGARA